MSSAIQTRFITVTTMVTGTPAPVYNSTQLEQLNYSKNVGQIVALSGLAIFVLMSLVLLLCTSILYCRRPRPPPMTQNPDAVKKGSEAFLPVIGKARKKSRKDNLEAATLSQQNLVPGLGGRRTSMWALEGQQDGEIGTVPSPPLLASHGRSVSGESYSTVGRASSYADTPYSEVDIAHPANYGYIDHHHPNQHMNAMPTHNAFRRELSPHLPSVRLAAQVSEGRYSFEEEPRGSPAVSPESTEGVRAWDRGRPLALPGTAYGGNGYDGGMYR